MNKLLRIVSIPIFFATIQFSTLRAQTSASLEEVRVDWHLAGVSEAASDYGSALGYFKEVVENAKYLPLVSREWYQGIGWLGISRSKARLGDTCGARRALATSFSHSFANAALLEQDTFFGPLVGINFIDSLNAFWSHIRMLNRSEWIQQEPMVFRPHDAQPGEPLIICLHGGNGNYRGFADYWTNVADSAKATVVVPPGIIRNSEVQNSWEFDLAAIFPSVESLRTECIRKYKADPTQVYLAGFSQGGQAAIGLTLLHPTLFVGALSFSGFLLDSLDESALSQASQQHVRFYALSGEWDSKDFLRSLGDIQRRCTKHGIPFHLELEEKMSHEMPLDFGSRFGEAWRWIRQPEPVYDVHSVGGSGQ